MALLDVRDLSINFGGVKALNGVSFGVEKGEFVGLMGPNGAGKTTVINCISRIYQSKTGRISFEGRDISAVRPHDLAELGISRTYQDLGFFANISEMPVIDYLKMGLFRDRLGAVLMDGFRARRSVSRELEAKKKARRILEFFRSMRESFEPPEEERGYPIMYGRGGFPDLLDMEYGPIGALSFAWQRRLDLARALISGPKLLLLDEPAQGLPPSEIVNLGKTLAKIRSELGTAALIVEHNIGMLMSVSSRIVVMNYGEKIAEGLPEDINANEKVVEIYLGHGKKDESVRVEIVGKKVERKTPVLEVQNVDVFYGQAQALSSVSVDLHPGQTTCVLGTNGSGKSTLLKTIGGLEKPTFGQILFKGEYLPLGWPEIAAERGIQYVPQGHIVFPRLTVLENLKIGAYSFEKRGQKADLERVFHFFPMLKDLLKSQGNDLSGGQQQMLAIGQAIIGKPEVLMLDEPSLGLSPKFVDTMFEIINRISVEEGCSILLVEQNVTKSLEISDYCYMMNTGTVISHGPSDQYIKNMPLVKKNLGFL